MFVGAHRCSWLLIVLMDAWGCLWGSQFFLWSCWVFVGAPDAPGYSLVLLGGGRVFGCSCRMGSWLVLGVVVGAPLVVLVFGCSWVRIASGWSSCCWVHMGHMGAPGCSWGAPGCFREPRERSWVLWLLLHGCSCVRLVDICRSNYMLLARSIC